MFPRTTNNSALTVSASMRKCKSITIMFILLPIAKIRNQTLFAHISQFDFMHINNSRKIVIRRIPDDKWGSYSDNDISKQATIFEYYLFKFKLSYGYYLDLSTLEKRVITLTSMTLRPRMNQMTRLPKLIVHIDMGKKK